MQLSSQRNRCAVFSSVLAVLLSLVPSSFAEDLNFSAAELPFIGGDGSQFNYLESITGRLAPIANLDTSDTGADDSGLNGFSKAIQQVISTQTGTINSLDSEQGATSPGGTSGPSTSPAVLPTNRGVEFTPFRYVEGRATEAVDPNAISALNSTELVTLDYPEEEVRTILRNLADLYELNIIIPDDLIGTASIKLKDVGWRQVFDILLKPVNFTFNESGNIVRIISMDTINNEPMTLRTFPIRYAKAEDIAKSLAPILQTKGGGTIQVDIRSNSLIVKDRPSVMLQIEKLLESSTLDQPSLQVMIEAKFIEVANMQGSSAGSDADGTGLDWWSGTRAPLSSQSVFETTNAEGDIETRLNPFLRLNAAANVGKGFTDSVNFGTAVFSPATYEIAIRALNTFNDAKLISNPTVVTLNNEKTMFHVGENRPIIEANFDEETGNYTVGEVEYLPLGIQLEVTPRINAGAEQITLEVKPKVSRQTGDVEFGGSAGGLIKYPIETIREIETKVNIKNGYTLALGGLIQDDESEKRQTVPVLGDLPVVGNLFSKKSKDKQKVNLLIFVTAKALNPDGGTYQDIVDPRQMKSLGIAAPDLPGYHLSQELAPDTPRMTSREKDLLDQLQKLRDDIAKKETLLSLQGEVDKVRGDSIASKSRKSRHARRRMN